MNKEKQNGRFCGNCRYYNAHYERCHVFFIRQRTGSCVKLKKLVGNKDSCELYKYRPYQEKTVTLEHIDNVMDDIKEMEKILQADNH